MMTKKLPKNEFAIAELRRRAAGLSIGGEAQDVPAGLCPAAVLVPVIDRDDEPHVLLTRRADDHPHHAGQISFPGGKICERDKTMEAAALRETYEETGIEARYIEILGRLAAHVTGTGFAIYPVLGVVQPGFQLAPCEREVAQIFEVPLSFVMDGGNYRDEEVSWKGVFRPSFVIRYGEHHIWGATATILKKMQERFYGQ